MKMRTRRMLILSLATACVTAVVAQDKKPTSFSPVVIQEDFASVVKRMSAAKAGLMKKQAALLEERYDMANRPASGVTMTKGKSCAGWRSSQTPQRYDVGKTRPDDP